MKKIIFSILFILVGLFLYGKYIEVNNFKIKYYTINNDTIPESFKDLKIIHFSDILYNSKTSTNFLEKLETKINNEKPDIIVFSGDLFKKEEQYTTDDYNTLKKFLSNLEASLYKYAVIGDNDYSNLDEYKDILYESNFNLLDNENSLLFYKDVTPINFIGINNVDNLNELLTTDVEYNYSLVITHKPDIMSSLKDYNVNTILSSHSLGGIINIPFYGGIIKKDGSQKYINDYYQLDNKELFISNGIGYEKFNFRLFNTPSINVYKFSN